MNTSRTVQQSIALSLSHPYNFYLTLTFTPIFKFSIPPTFTLNGTFFTIIFSFLAEEGNIQTNKK